MTTKAIPRNAFVALCEIASQNNWCWKIHCTTCGHMSFRYAFGRLAVGQHPDDKEVWPNTKDDYEFLKESGEYKAMYVQNCPVVYQVRLAELVADAQISDIMAVTKYPDWLGYIGLVFCHCPNPKAKKIISDSLLPQFINLVKKDSQAYNHLLGKQNDGVMLDISDLNSIETSLLA